MTVSEQLLPGHSLTTPGARDLEAEVSKIPLFRAPFGSGARGEVHPGTNLMPFYYGDGSLWFILDMETCEEVKRPVRLEHGPTLPFAMKIDRIAEAEGKKHCQVYFIGHDRNTPIKIGTSISAAHRIKALQYSSPLKLHILAVRAGSNAVEMAYHEHFAAHRLHGEWFHAAPDILAEIDRLKSEQPS